MKSRMDKYNGDVLSRSSKNKHLYDDLYANTNYTNMVVIDDSNEIDISKIKEIIDREKKEKKIPKEAILSSDIYDNMSKIKEEPKKKVYDINEVLKRAKEKRDIIEEANEKRKREHYNLKTNKNIEKELEKTRKVYQNLINEEKEILNIMNTLTSASSADIALDLFEDLKPSDNEKTVSDTRKSDVNIRQIENDDSREYSTDTFMFNTKDFEGIEHFKGDVKKMSAVIKVLIFILTVAVVCVGIFVVKKYLIK